eukprot:gene597-326_t
MLVMCDVLCFFCVREELMRLLAGYDFKNTYIQPQKEKRRHFKEEVESHATAQVASGRRRSPPHTPFPHMAQRASTPATASGACCSVLLCDGCHQPLATLQGILGYDERVRESAKDGFRYRLQGLFDVPLPSSRPTPQPSPASVHPTGSGGEAPAATAVEEEEEEEEEEEGVWAYSAVNPNEQRFDLLRVTPYLRLPCSSPRPSRTQSQTHRGPEPSPPPAASTSHDVAGQGSERNRRSPGVGHHRPAVRTSSFASPQQQRRLSSTPTEETPDTNPRPSTSPDLCQPLPEEDREGEEGREEEEEEVDGGGRCPVVSPFRFSGPYSPENTFFLGYQWQCCSCNMCGKFLGWGFAKEPERHRPNSPKREEEKEEEKEGKGEFEIDHPYINPETPPEFVGLILRMCTSRDDFAVQRLRRILSSFTRRQRQSNALQRFAAKWLAMLRRRPTDILVHSLVRAFQQRRQEFLNAMIDGVADGGGGGVWVEPRPEAPPTPASASTSPDSEQQQQQQQSPVLTRPYSVGSRASGAGGGLLRFPVLPSTDLNAAEEAEWAELLRLLPGCFAGLLAAAWALPLIQAPVIGVEEHQRQLRRRQRQLQRHARAAAAAAAASAISSDLDDEEEEEAVGGSGDAEDRETGSTPPPAAAGRGPGGGGGDGGGSTGVSLDRRTRPRPLHPARTTTNNNSSAAASTAGDGFSPPSSSSHPADTTTPTHSAAPPTGRVRRLVSPRSAGVAAATAGAANTRGAAAAVEIDVASGGSSDEDDDGHHHHGGRARSRQRPRYRQAQVYPRIGDVGDAFDGGGVVLQLDGGDGDLLFMRDPYASYESEEDGGGGRGLLELAGPDLAEGEMLEIFEGSTVTEEEEEEEEGRRRSQELTPSRGSSHHSASSEQQLSRPPRRRRRRSYDGQVIIFNTTPARRRSEGSSSRGDGSAPIPKIASMMILSPTHTHPVSYTGVGSTVAFGVGQLRSARLDFSPLDQRARLDPVLMELHVRSNADLLADVRAFLFLFIYLYINMYGELHGTAAIIIIIIKELDKQKQSVSVCGCTPFSSTHPPPPYPLNSFILLLCCRMFCLYLDYLFI